VQGALTEISFPTPQNWKMTRIPQYEYWHTFEKKGEMWRKMSEVKKEIQYHMEYFNTCISSSLSGLSVETRIN
jgi:hypothetical protein